MDHLTKHLIERRSLRLMRGECEWDKSNIPVWSRLLNTGPEDVSPATRENLREQITQIPAGDLRAMLWLSLQAPEQTGLNTAPLTRDDTDRLADLQACPPGGVPHTLLCWALLEHPSPELSAAARNTALQGLLAPGPASWAITPPGITGSDQNPAEKFWTDTLVQRRAQLRPETLDWLARHAPAEHRLRYEVMFYFTGRVNLLSPNTQAANLNFTVNTHAAETLLRDWEAGHHPLKPRLHMISEPAPSTTWPLKPILMDRLWCWHDLAPKLDPQELATRSVIYPLASPRCRQSGGWRPSDRHDSIETQMLLILWPHETRSITQVPRPAELWTSLRKNALDWITEEGQRPWEPQFMTQACSRRLHWRALQVWLAWNWPGARPRLRDVTTSLRRLQEAAEVAAAQHAS